MKRLLLPLQLIVAFCLPASATITIYQLDSNPDDLSGLEALIGY